MKIISVKKENGESNTIRAWFWTILLCEVLLVLFWDIVIHRPLAISNDSALYIHFGQMLSEGKMPYVDFIDTNPPLIIYLNLIPVLIARLLSVNVIMVFSLTVLSLAILSTLTIRSILTSHAVFDEDELGIIILLWFMLSFTFRAVGNVYNYGQREHLFVLFYFPFFMLRWIRWEKGDVRFPMAAFVAVAAGLGACLKPHFVFVSLAPEIYWSISKRNIRNLVKSETVIFAGTVLVYAAHFIILPVEMREAFLYRWLPFVTKNYQTYNCSLYILRTHISFQFALIMVLLPFLLPPINEGFGSMVRPLAIFTFAGIIIYFIQHKGFDYHTIPALCGAMLILAITTIQNTKLISRKIKQNGLNSNIRLATQLLAILTSAYILQKGIHLLILVGGIFFFTAFTQIKNHIYQRVKKHAYHRYTSSIVQVLILVSTLTLFWRWNFKQDYDPLRNNPLADKISQYSKEDDPVLFISKDVWPGYPLLVQMNRRPGSRYLHSFPIQMFHNGVQLNSNGEFPYRTREECSEEELLFLGELSEDIIRIRPPIIFVSTNGQNHPIKIDIMEYLTRVDFIEQTMKGYKLLPKSSNVISWRIFVLDEKDMDFKTTFQKKRGHRTLKRRWQEWA